jgi:menaquinone-dependent protoporphyrinogen oxidase
MSRILIVYATTDGHTLKICQRIQALLQQRDHQVTLMPVADVIEQAPAGFDKIVVGASIRYGKHAKPVYRLVTQQRGLLESCPSAFFSVNVVARKPTKALPENNPYLQKFLRQISWKPTLVDVFAGKLDYPRYGRVDRFMIRLIMWVTRGPTDVHACVEFTDWQRVADFAARVDLL